MHLSGTFINACPQLLGAAFFTFSKVPPRLMHITCRLIVQSVQECPVSHSDLVARVNTEVKLIGTVFHLGRCLRTGPRGRGLHRMVERSIP